MTCKPVFCFKQSSVSVIARRPIYNKLIHTCLIVANLLIWINKYINNVMSQKKMLSWITKETRKKALGSFIDPTRWLNVSPPSPSWVWRRFNEGQLQGHLNPPQNICSFSNQNKKQLIGLKFR